MVIIPIKVEKYSAARRHKGDDNRASNPMPEFQTSCEAGKFKGEGETGGDAAAPGDAAPNEFTFINMCPDDDQYGEGQQRREETTRLIVLEHSAEIEK